MKVLLCLMATIAACNAGLLTGGHGHGHVQVEIEPQHIHHVHDVEHIHHLPQVEHVEHVHHLPQEELVHHVPHVEHVQHVPHVQHVVAAPQPQVQIVQLNDGGYAGGYGGGYSGGYSSGYAGGHASYSSGHSHGYSGATYSQPQIIKVIHEHAAPVGHDVSTGYATQGYSIGHGHSHGHSYAPNYSYKSSLEAILPQILQIVLQDSGSSGSSYAGQVINAFGNKGRVIVTKGKGISPLRSGHVVEKGHIEVVKVERKTVQGKSGGSFGGIAQLFGGKGGQMSGKW